MDVAIIRLEVLLFLHNGDSEGEVGLFLLSSEKISVLEGMDAVVDLDRSRVILSVLAVGLGLLDLVIVHEAGISSY